MPVTGNKSLYGAGYINGTIIGIPKGGKNQRPRVGPRQVPDDQQPCAGDRSRTASATSPRRARRRSRRSSSRTTNFAAFTKHLHAPEVVDDPRDAARLGAPRDLHELPRQVAGRQGEGPAGRPRSRSTSRSTPSSSSRAAECRDEPELAATEAVPAPVAATIADEPGERANWRRRLTVLAFLSPLARRLLRLLRLPARDERLALPPQLRPAQPARWVGLANYRYMFGRRPADLARRVEHAVADRRLRAVRPSCSRFGIAMLLTRARSGVGVFRTDLLPARARAARGRDARLRLPAQPRRRARSTSSSAGSGSRGRSGSTTPAGRSRHS